MTKPTRVGDQVEVVVVEGEGKIKGSDYIGSGLKKNSARQLHKVPK